MKNWSWVMALIFVGSLIVMAPGMAESRITDVSAAPQGCGVALNDNGTVWLWGSLYYDIQFINEHPGLGLKPVIAPGIDHVVAISGYTWPVVLKDDGTVWIIKNYPIFENASLLATYPDNEPVKVPGLDNIVAISGNNANLLMLSKNGTVWVMGQNGYGQLGPAVPYGMGGYDPETGVPREIINQEYLTQPVQVTGLSDIKAIAMGDGHGLALKSDGTVWSWGENDFGQRGDGTIIQFPDGSKDGNPVPGMVKGLTNVTDIAAGVYFSTALKDDGTVWAWGSNRDGELGDGIPGNVEDNRTTPVRVAGLTNATAISASGWRALALRDDGSAWAWGRSGNSLTGNEYPYNYAPVQVENLTGIVSISAGWMNSLALDKYGVVWAWGDDEGGQLGDGKEGPGLVRDTWGKVPFTETLAGPAIGPSSSESPPIQVSTPTPDSNDIEYMAAVNDTIYSFTVHGLTALDNKGVPKWDLSIPGLWTYNIGLILPVWKNDSGIDMGQMFQPVPIFAADNGCVYLYTIKDPADGAYDAWQDMGSLQRPNKYVVKELTAVSPGGKIAWTHDFTDDVAVDDRSHLEAHGGRLYLYHDYNETVLDISGKVLFNLENVSDPVSVDENGNIYAVMALKLASEKYFNEASGQYLDYRVPSNVVEKYSPEGARSWSKTLGSNVSRSYYVPSAWNGEIGLPLYWKDILYVPRDTGVLAMNKDGNVLWDKGLDGTYRAFNLMPMDSKGNIYMYTRTFDDANYTVVAISPAGTEIARYKAGPYIASAADGIIYENGKLAGEGGAGIGRNNLETATVTAYDLPGGKYLWNFTTPIGQTNTVIINESNVKVLFPDESRNGMKPGSVINDHSRAEVIPAGDLTYIYFRTSMNDEPVEYNKSAYTFYSALYAVDKSGKLVWQMPMNDFLTAAAANNSTIYYGTNGGGISVSTVVVAAAGLALIGAALVAAKFFLFGSVSRARSRIDKNDNRNRTYRFIAEHPGSTLYGMSKEMGLNIGTLRYHLMILGLNHRIVTYNDDGKFVRYFTNSNSYTREDQMVISLVRRETMGKLLKILLDRDAATNIELCDALGIPDSAVSKHLGELVKKGVVVKNPSQTIRASYSIDVAQATRVANALRLIGA